ncbi:MAG TPA: hypothetical protein VFW23_06310 [Tepidisphaeraceae bacterium]|nr:hypothetical protein [Tepidisphaeraceae bacterium]
MILIFLNKIYVPVFGASGVPRFAKRQERQGCQEENSKNDFLGVLGVLGFLGDLGAKVIA